MFYFSQPYLDVFHFHHWSKNTESNFKYFFFVLDAASKLQQTSDSAKIRFNKDKFIKIFAQKETKSHPFKKEFVKCKCEVIFTGQWVKDGGL